MRHAPMRHAHKTHTPLPMSRRTKLSDSFVCPLLALVTFYLYYSNISVLVRDKFYNHSVNDGQVLAWQYQQRANC
jgi:hypothetical protein